MAYQHTPQSRSTIAALWRLEKIILDSLNFNEVVQKICDSVLLELGYLNLGYEIVVLCLVDDKTNTLRRIAISKTAKAKLALKESPIPFHNIIIPLHDNKNILVKSIDEKKLKITTHWPDILCPSFTAHDAINIQNELNIEGSLVFPVISHHKAIGTLIFSMSKPPSKMTADEEDLIRSFSDIVGLAVQNASLYSKLEDTTKKLAKANRNLRHLDKLKDEFVFIATHELKNPVTAMKGYLSMLFEGLFGPIPEKMTDPLNQLQYSNQQLVDLVNDLLQIARAEAKTLQIETKPIDLSQVITFVTENLKPLADQKHMAITYKKLNDKPLVVLADDNRCKEIMNNLVSNALKYSDQGTITVSHELDGHDVVTHVKDEGFGIADKDKAKIFTKFFRVDEEAAKGIPGTGLGLFIVKQIIEKMGGKIWFTSTYGQGTTFTFTLPKG